MKCATCKHSGPTMAYPKLYCWAFAIYTEKRENCARWEGK